MLLQYIVPKNRNRNERGDNVLNPHVSEMKPEDCPVCAYIYRAIDLMIQQGVEFDIDKLTGEDGIHCTNGHKILGEMMLVH